MDYLLLLNDFERDLAQFGCRIGERAPVGAYDALRGSKAPKVDHGLTHTVEGVAPHYQIIITPTDTMDLLEIKVEMRPEAFSDNIREVEALRKRVFAAVKQIIGLSPRITLVEPGSLPRSEGKIRRVIDHRKD